MQIGLMALIRYVMILMPYEKIMSGKYHRKCPDFIQYKSRTYKYPENVRRMFQNVIVSGHSFFVRNRSGIFFVQNLSWPDFVKLKDGYCLMMIISCTIIMLSSLKFIIIDSIFARSAKLLSMSRRVSNVNFALLTFFYKN